MESFYSDNITREEFIVEKRHYINTLTEWVKDLPVMEGSLNDGIAI